jgi:outer membrane usher protein
VWATAGTINDSGYGILPYMSAYRENRVSLDIRTLENDVEVIPPPPPPAAVYAGEFETDEGRSVVLELGVTITALFHWALTC